MGFPTTDHSEVHGWPKEHYTYRGAEQTRKLRCAWSDRITLAVELDEAANRVYPYDNSGSILNDIKTERERNSKHSDAGNGMISYDNAILTCHYSTLGPLTGNLISERFTTAMEGGKWGHEGLYWSNDGSNPLVSGEGPQRLFPKMTYTLQYHRLSAVPASVYTLGGYINSNTYFTKILGVYILPYYLLYDCADVTRTLTAGGSTMFNVKHKCTYTYNGGLGWNGVWRPKAKAFGAIYQANGTQVYPYPWTVFNL